MELLFWIDAFSRASVDSITVIIPYFSYANGDKKDEPRVSTIWLEVDPIGIEPTTPAMPWRCSTK